MFSRINQAFAKSRSEDGFTLLELLVVVVMIGILSAIAVPVFINAQNAAHDASVKSDARNTVISVASALVTQPEATGFSVLAPSDTTASVKISGVPSVVVTVPTGAVAVRGVVTQSNWVTVQGTSADYVVHAQSTVDGFWYEFSSKTGKYTSLADTPAVTPGVPSSKTPIPNSVQNPDGIPVRIIGDPVTALSSSLAGSVRVSDTSDILTYAIDTTIPGCSTTYIAPISSPTGGKVLATIDWGDGSTVEDIGWNNYPNHTYATSGSYNITVTGNVPHFGNRATANSQGCTTAVTRWGQGTGTVSTENAFMYAQSLTAVATPPNTITNMSNMFYYAMAFNQPVNFDTRNVTNMSNMFSQATAFNQQVSLNTSKVTTMAGIFSGATVFNRPVNFNTSNVTDMSYMFYGTKAFNQLLTFDTAKVTSVAGMFKQAKVFNQPLTFNTANVTNFSTMFYMASAFNQPLTFTTDKATDMFNMFAYTPAFN